MQISLCRRFQDGDQSYHMSFWADAYRTKQKLYLQIPYMQGAGGNTVLLAPNGISAFRFTDAMEFDVAPLIRVVEAVRELPVGQDDPIRLDTDKDR